MRSRLRLAAFVAAAAVAASACAAGSRTTFPPPGSTPAQVGDATAATTRLVLAALSAAGLPGEESLRRYRPPEGALLTAAPRSVVQAILPDDPDHGFIVIYAFASDAAAQAAAEDQAAYVASGVGRIQFASDARFVLRVAGSTVVFYWWSPAAALDPRAGTIADALASVGAEVPVAG